MTQSIVVLSEHNCQLTVTKWRWEGTKKQQVGTKLGQEMVKRQIDLEHPGSVIVGLIPDATSRKTEEVTVKRPGCGS